MAIPGFQDLMLPILKLSEDRQEHTIREIIDSLAIVLNLSEAEKKLPNSKSKQFKFDNRIRWALYYLKNAKLLDSPVNGTFLLSDQGVEVLKENPPLINLAYLKQLKDSSGIDPSLEIDANPVDQDESEPPDSIEIIQPKPINKEAPKSRGVRFLDEEPSDIPQPVSLELEELKKAFQEFRQDPFAMLQVEVRQARAAQIRQLLSNPDSISVKIFNSEVWNFETSTKLRGVEIKNTLFGKEVLGAQRIAEFREALYAGQLELHGNYIWGTASRIYGPTVTEDEERLGYLRQALGFLNAPNLTPLEKVNKLLQLKGFGYNISTGLMMIFHPDEFALYNFPSQKAMRKLGFPEKTLETFEQAALELKEILGATDFLELDWFLYQQNDNNGHNLKDAQLELENLNLIQEVTEGDDLDEELEPGKIESISLEEWKAYVQANAQRELVRTIAREYPDWLQQTFEDKIQINKFEGAGGKALSVWSEKDWVINTFFNNRRNIFIHIKLKEEEYQQLRRSLKHPDGLRKRANQPQSVERSIYSLWLSNYQDYQAIKNILVSIITPQDETLYDPAALKSQIDIFKFRYVSFDSTAYNTDEREYKLDAINRFRQLLNKELLESFIQAGKYEEAKTNIKKAYSKDRDNPYLNLMNQFDTIPIRETPAEKLVPQLYNLLYGGEPFGQRFDAWVELLGGEKERCWPAATFYLMLHDPNEHIFVKPGPYRNILEETNSSLEWKTRPTAAYYQKLQKLSRQLLTELAPLGARDMVDVQSFIWVLNHDETVLKELTMLAAAYNILAAAGNNPISLQNIYQQARALSHDDQTSSSHLSEAMLQDSRFLQLGGDLWTLVEFSPQKTLLPTAWPLLASYVGFTISLENRSYTAEELYQLAKGFGREFNQNINAITLVQNLRQFRLLKSVENNTYILQDYVTPNLSALLKLAILALLLPAQASYELPSLKIINQNWNLHTVKAEVEFAPELGSEGGKLLGWYLEAELVELSDTGWQPTPLVELAGDDPTTRTFNKVVKTLLATQNDLKEINDVLPHLVKEELDEKLQRLSQDLLIDDLIVKRIYRSLVSGRHVVLSGPPGTGKTELAKRLPALLWEEPEIRFDYLTMILDEVPVKEKTEKRHGYKAMVVTATEDWGVRDVVGGIGPRMSGDGKTLSYEIQYGVLTKAVLQNYTNTDRGKIIPNTWERSDYYEGDTQYRGIWLIIDEFTRAPVDAAFGSLLTTLGGGVNAFLNVPSAEGEVAVPLPKDFRIIGTLNSFDRHFLNQISEAIKRRFDFIDVLPPAPSLGQYEQGVAINNALRRLYSNGFVGITQDSTRQLYEWVDVLKVSYEGTMHRMTCEPTDNEAKTALISFWRIFKAIRVFRQLGTAQAEAVYTNLFAGQRILKDWVVALDIAFADSLADQLQVLTRDEQQLLVLYLDYADNVTEFTKRVNGVMDKSKGRKLTLLHTLSVAEELRTGTEASILPDSSQPLTDTQLGKVFDLGEPLSLPTGAASIFKTRLKNLLGERGL